VQVTASMHGPRRETRGRIARRGTSRGHRTRIQIEVVITGIAIIYANLREWRAGTGQIDVFAGDWRRRELEYSRR
jgi:hypothetical protein